jgi:hypothetical protein
MSVADARAARTALVAKTVLDQAERIRLAFWAKMPSFNIVK